MKYYKAFTLVVVSILIVISCEKPHTENTKTELDLVFNGFSIQLVRDSVAFGKLDDIIEVKSSGKTACFLINKADSVIIVDSIDNEVCLKIHSKMHNSKSCQETILILKTDENSFYSLSTYGQFKPIGYPRNTGASLQKENDRIVVSFFNNSERSIYTIDIGDKRGLATRSFAKEIEDKYEIANFFKETNGKIFNEEKNDIDILVN